MKPNMIRVGLLCAASVIALSSQARAQQAPAAAGPGEATTGEIVVTAQKRAENVQTVPISMTAISGKNLADKAVKTLSDLQFASPGLSVTNAGLTQSVNIRGIGLASGSPNAANGVATYVDGVFQPPIVSAGDYYDLADVEVLRGPQGTFVGSNSTGGAIFINSQSPQLGKFGGYGQVGGGSYDALYAQGALNVPIGDTLAVRLALNEQRHDSYFTDHGVYHNKPDRLDELGSRLGINWQPAPWYQATFKLEQLTKETGGYAYQPVPGTTYATGYSEPSIRDLDYNSPTSNNERAIQGTLEQHFILPDGITIKSITAYQNKQIHNLYDVDATSAAGSTEDQFVREKEYTQEIDILSPTSGRLSWIAGGYFQRNRIDVIIEDGAFPTHILVQNKKTTLGGFGQVSYNISDDLTATVGLRYSTYKVDGSGDVKIGAGIPGFPATGLVVADTGGKEQDDAVTGKANLDWRFAPNNLLYAFAARGYKPGGINSETENFQKETVWNYEVGWKSTLLDGRVKTQVDAFYNSYDDFQFDTVNTATGQGAVQNVPTATIDGFEAQAQGKFGHLRLDGSLAYVHSRLGTYTVIDQAALLGATLEPQCKAGQTPPACTDYMQPGVTKTITGASNLFSPDFTFNGGAQYAFDLGSGFTITPRINYAYQTSQDGSPARDPFYVIKARGLLSALLTVEKQDWMLQFRVTNATDEKYVSGYSISGAAGSQFYGAPREFAVLLRRDF